MQTLKRTMGTKRSATKGLLAVLIASFLAACAAESKDASTPAKTPPNEPRVDNAGAAPSPDLAPRANLSRAQADLDLALSQSTADCASACRALASLERAATHLCELSDPSECNDAKKRVETARDRVTKACGACR